MPVTAGFRDSQDHNEMILVSIRRRPTRHNFSALDLTHHSLEVSESIPSHDEYTDSHALTDGSVVAHADVEDAVAGGETGEAEKSVAVSTWARLRSIFRP